MPRCKPGFCAFLQKFHCIAWCAQLHISVVSDSENTVQWHAVLKGKKSTLTRGLGSGIFRIHIRYSISAKKGKQQNTSKLKYQCICTPYSWLIKISNCSTSIFHTVKQCFFCFMHFLICSKNASSHVLSLWALNNFFIRSNLLLSQFMLQYVPIQPPPTPFF